MTDSAPTEQPLETSWRIVFAILSLAFNAGLVVWIVLYGKPDNSLHSSALAWCFTVGGGTLAGVGFGQILQFLPFNKK